MNRLFLRLISGRGGTDRGQLFPFSCFLFILFFLFPSISIDDMGATSGGFFLLDLSLFLLCDHGLDL